MGDSDDLIKHIENNLPILASSKDLVKLGVYGSESALSKARKLGHSPDYIQFSQGKIMYEKSAVIKFFRSCMKKGS